MNDLFFELGTGYGVLYTIKDEWCGISTGYWNFYLVHAPAFSFTNDTNTGFFKPHKSQLKIK